MTRGIYVQTTLAKLNGDEYTGRNENFASLILLVSRRRITIANNENLFKTADEFS